MPLVGRHQLRSTSHLSDLEEDSGTIVQKGIEVVAVTAETDRQRVIKLYPRSCTYVSSCDKLKIC